MKTLVKRFTAFVALAAAFGLGSFEPAHAASAVVANGATCRIVATPAWTLVRVSVSENGAIQGMRIAYHSGNAAFNASALRTVAATSFGAARRHVAPSTFDYLIATDGRGTRVGRIVHRLGATGDEAWTAYAPNVRTC